MIAIARSRFNEDVTSRLLKSCLAALKGERTEVFEVPGGFELPWLVNELARSQRFKAVIALGCILKGATPQNEHMARSTVSQLHAIAVSTRVPVILGVITPNTYAQALARTRGGLDRGREAAQAALEVLALRRRLEGRNG